MNRFAGLVLAFILFSASTFPVSASTGDELLPSGVAIADLETMVDEYVAEHESTTAALSVAVFTGDEVLFQKAYGYTDLENRIANDGDSVVEWGSVTKLLVWVSVMQLAERGLLDLNEDIRTYLPDGFLTKLNYETPITMLHLMNHTAGWQEIATDLFIANPADVKSLADGLKLVEPEQVFEPGTVVAYSNWGSALAGYIVERASGQSFDVYVRENIFEPLGMDRTAIHSLLADHEWVANQRAKQKHYTAANQPLGTNLYYISLYPAGMATGAFSDLVKFGQAFLPPDGEPSPLFDGRETLDEMLSPALYFADGVTPRNMHGFWTDVYAVPVVWHNGQTKGSTAWFTLDPENGIGLITNTNQPDETTYNVGLLSMVFGRYSGEAGSAASGDISGLYVGARSIFKGFGKAYSLATLMQVDPGDAGGFVVPGTPRTLQPIGENAYLMDMGGRKQYQVFAAHGADGRRILQFPGMDYLEVNGTVEIARMALLGLFAAAGLFSLGNLVGGLVGIVKRRRAAGAFEPFRLLVHLAVVAALALTGYMAATLFSPAPLFKDVQWSLVLNGLLALIPVAYVAVLVVRWAKLDPTRKEKGKLIAAGTAGLVMTVNIVFWEVYKFW